MTTSCKLHFGTAEYLANWQIDTASSALQKVMQLYTCHGFWIKAVHADPKFQALKAHHPNLSFNFCAQNEHIPEIEWYICTTKDCVHSAYNLLPFSHIP